MWWEKITEKVPLYRVAVSCESKAQTFQEDLLDTLLLEDNSNEHDTAKLPQIDIRTDIFCADWGNLTELCLLYGKAWRIVCAIAEFL